MKQDLGVSVDPSIELVVRLDRLVDTDFVADDKAGFRLSGYDQVAQVAVVCFDVALSSAEVETLDWCQHDKLDSLVERQFTFSKSLPKEMRICPFPLCSSGAPGSAGT